MQRILIIEDEVKTAQSIRQGLEEQQYKVDIAYDGEMGKRLATRHKFDLIISDIILPGINGIELCRQLRAEKIQTPVLMLTALSTVDDKVEGFESGADDYLPKPFEFKELLARIRAMLKRNPQTNTADREITVADLSLNLDNRKATRGGKEIELTAREFALLEFFMRNVGRVLSKVEIAERVWGIDFDTGTNVVEVYINYLRKKIDREFPLKLIHTQFGMGYIMKEK
ncbi:MAG TPA: response regulator transcription factor [Bacteroidia bacterium]|nr:response regulator transcription factor [Bacteroidia bacterium]